ncbi:MAG TPA: M1 family metallopeptidase, partial [Bacteroidia bacterium]|nr:M1 family metallopeptidase [Bacteroidia bacterium]
MRKQVLFTILLAISSIGGFSQNYNSPANNYRSVGNPYYWQNRPPYKGYWQQDIHYTIVASLNDSSDIISGDETLLYWNNSQDTLNCAFFHLYDNAQNRHSYYTSVYNNSGYKVKFGKYESQDLGCQVLNISADNTNLKTEVDNTVMKVWLNQPLLPGHSITFHVKFKTYFDPGGSVRNRMKMFIAYMSKKKDTVYKQYDVVHWYPRMCVYDKKFGWDVEQHLAHEFYGDFGTYDIAFTLPNNYIAGATGTLLNEKEMLPDSLMRKIDIRNFKNRKSSAPPIVAVKRTNATKTWLYHAENVHDFALTADPTYRIGLYTWNGIKCYSYAEEANAPRWQDAAEYTAAVIACNSKFFGPYGYPQMIVADARDGMEYPMITLDGGGFPDYLPTLTHEVSHNWFFGMLGSNETYRAVLDEGFTEFAECWTYEQLNGPYQLEGRPVSKYVNKYYKKDLFTMTWSYNGYLNNYIWGEPEFTENMQGKSMATRFMYSDYFGTRDVTLNTQSDDFHSMLAHDGGYTQVYNKGSVMLYNLQYVLGDSLFFGAMQHYFTEWKFAHPYLNDFRNAITEYTHADLTWFFDEWLNTGKSLDYGIQSIKKGKDKNQYIIRFARKGEMQMPIDFAVTSNRDSVYNFYIPNGWFEKKTSAKKLPRWIGWGKVQPYY